MGEGGREGRGRKGRGRRDVGRKGGGDRREGRMGVNQASYSCQGRRPTEGTLPLVFLT